MKKKILTLVLAAAFPVFARAGTAPSSQLAGLAASLGKALGDRPGLKLAVLQFPYVGGAASAGPAVVQERLTTELAQNKKLTLVERALLDKVMQELKLETSGAMDEAAVKKLGKQLGADAVVTGTLSDLKDGGTEVNARVVETETGRILAAASAVVRKDWTDSPLPPKPAPKDFGGKPLVQVAILLDTSNSMDGLINQARTQLWKIVNELVTAEKSGSRPKIEVALYEYGNTALSQKNGWIRQVTPFTTDLDKVSAELFSLKTDGGDEYCGQVIGDAVDGLKWSPRNDVYKAIFIAGNEPFTQGVVPFQDSVAKAKAKGIFVNTIFCGPRQEGIAGQWKTGADLADGDYANIDQSLQRYAVAAPQDDRIAELSDRLNDTYIAYGASGKDRLMAKESSLSLAKGAGAAVMAERGAYQAAPAAARADASWDVVSALDSGAMQEKDIQEDQLPESLRAMSKADRDKYIAAKLAERKKITAEINALQAGRKAYLAAQERKQASAATLDSAMISTIRRQASGRGYSFPK